MLSRNTYLEIDTNHIRNNVNKIINTFKGYKYYFGVVKADCYGHSDINVVKAIIAGGCNYLAVATLDEAIIIREEIKDIPILCLGHVTSQYMDMCKKQNITVTIHSFENLQEILREDYTEVKVHLKINTGMNRLGFSNKKEIQEAIKLIKKNEIKLEGIYTHIYHASSKMDYENQIRKMENLISDIDLNDIPIIHVSASEALTDYTKLDFANGCRLGIIMYGFTEHKELNLESTMSLLSEVVQINEIQKNEKVGYNGAYVGNENGERIAVVSIGYADGIIRKNTGRNVYINNKPYQIVGNVCMDMLFIKVDENVKLYDKVYILKDIQHIEEVARHLDTIPYEVICSVGKRIPRICKNYI